MQKPYNAKIETKVLMQKPYNAKIETKVCIRTNEWTDLKTIVVLQHFIKIKALKSKTKNHIDTDIKATDIKAKAKIYQRI